MFRKIIKPFFYLTIISSLITGQNEQRIYSKAYGDPSDPAIIFLHGGPGYNCAGFEFTTAQTLLESGFYVIVYDQRGCGRSQGFNDAEFTLRENLLE